MAGVLKINKVPGNLHFSLQGSNRQLAEAVLATGYPIKLNHKINRFQFGEDNEELLFLKQKFGRGQKWNPLEGTIGSQPYVLGSPEFGFYTAYYMDVLQTLYVNL